MIDRAVNELAKLKLRLDNNPKKSRKELNTIKKISRDPGYDTGFDPLCGIEKEYSVTLITRKVIPILYRSIYRSNDFPYNEFYCDICPTVPHTGCCNYCIFNPKCFASKN